MNKFIKVILTMKDGKIDTFVSNVNVELLLVNDDLTDETGRIQRPSAFVIKSRRKKAY